MIKVVNANELTKIELKINTSELYTWCDCCKNRVAIDACEDYKSGRKFDEMAKETLENKLIYGELENGVLDTSFHFVCPICWGGHKLIPLKFELEGCKQVMIFKGEVIKMPILKEFEGGKK